MKKVVIFAANECAPEKNYYQYAYDMGKELAKAGFAVVNGAGGGLMKQSLKGAFEAGGMTFGIGLDIENRKQCEYAKNLRVFKDLKERQKNLVELADAIVALPGGMGTVYEILEIIALKRVGQLNPQMPFVIFGEYYNALDKMFQAMYTEGFASPKISRYYSFVSSVEQAIQIIKTNI